jgi:hypothetical protein
VYVYVLCKQLQLFLPDAPHADGQAFARLAGIHKVLQPLAELESSDDSDSDVSDNDNNNDTADTTDSTTKDSTSGSSGTALQLTTIIILCSSWCMLVCIRSICQ